VKGAWVFEHPFFVILNLAVGGYWPGNPDAEHQLPAADAGRLRAGLPPRRLRRPRSAASAAAGK
jgi:hypothetical protein